MEEGVAQMAVFEIALHPLMGARGEGGGEKMDDLVEGQVAGLAFEIEAGRLPPRRDPALERSISAQGLESDALEMDDGAAIGEAGFEVEEGDGDEFRLGIGHLPDHVAPGEAQEESAAAGVRLIDELPLEMGLDAFDFVGHAPNIEGLGLEVIGDLRGGVGDFAHLGGDDRQAQLSIGGGEVCGSRAQMAVGGDIEREVSGDGHVEIDDGSKFGQEGREGLDGEILNVTGEVQDIFADSLGAGKVEAPGLPGCASDALDAADDAVRGFVEGEREVVGGPFSAAGLIEEAEMGVLNEDAGEVVEGGRAAGGGIEAVEGIGEEGEIGHLSGEGVGGGVLVEAEEEADAAAGLAHDRDGCAGEVDPDRAQLAEEQGGCAHADFDVADMAAHIA